MGAIPTSTQQAVNDAYNKLNEDAATNDPSLSGQVQTDVQILKTAVSQDSGLSTAQVNNIEQMVTTILPMAGVVGNASAWNADMQNLYETLSALPTTGTNTGSTKATSGTTTGGASYTGGTGGEGNAGGTSGAGGTNATTKQTSAAASNPVPGNSASSSASLAAGAAPLTDTTLYPGGNGPAAGDVKQGQTNDCTLDADLIFMQENNPTGIANMIGKQTSDGGYDITMYPKGVKTTVHVTAADLDNTGTNSTTGTKDWASYIEAAAEKIMPTWDESDLEAIDLQNGKAFAGGANPATVMQLLTGSAGTAGAPSDLGTGDTLIDSLNKLTSAGKLVNAAILNQGSSTPVTIDGTTLEPNHAYAVVGASNGQVTLVNPHNDGTPDGGTFTMSAADFAAAFPNYLCYQN